MDNFFIVERRVNAQTVDANLFLTNSLNKAVQWIYDNKDWESKDSTWYWVLISIELDNPVGGELFKVFDWDGNELEGQPV